MQNFVFVVRCEKIGKKDAYSVTFSYNEQLIERIKSLPQDTRKWNNINKCWEITTKSLFELIKGFKGSNRILFDFGGDAGRDLFIQNVNKIKIKEEEKLKLISELNEKKKYWVKYKEELENEYVKYIEKCHSNLKEGVKLYPHQIVSSMFMDITRNTLISHEMGLGKAESLDSKLLTPNGWIKMGDVKINDFVIGSDGKPKKVLGVYPQGFKDMYEVCFSDGTSVECCDEHLWNVNTYIRNWRKNPFMTKTLREIMNEGLQFKNGNNKWYIPIIQPVEFKENDLKINPYILGCLLGDGTIGLNSIQFTTADTEIIDILLKRLNENIIISKLLAKYQYSLKRINNKILNVYVNELKQLNLLGTNSYTKFIPDSYKFSSIEQRLELLQGILDTDGHSRKDGIVELTLASKQLIEDVQFIVESLGGVGRLHEKWIKYNGENRLYYRLNIKLPPHFIPFKLKRKIETFVAPTKYLPNRAIVDVKYVGKKEAQCILIDSEDHLYATDHCILTHNTLSAITFVEMNEFEKVFVITPNSLKFNFYNEVGKYTNSLAHIVGWNKNTCSIKDAKYIIVNYDFFNPSSYERYKRKWDKLNIDTIDCLICDECQKLKNSSTNIYKNFKKTFKGGLFRNGNVSKIFLSGTPAPNRAHELYTVLHEISPLDFPTKKHFYEYYCGMKYDFANGWGYIIDEMEQRFEELYHKIAPYTHRKRKIDVLIDLPDKIYQKVILELNNDEQKIYDDIEEGVANEFTSKELYNPLTIMLKLRQFTSSLKIKSIVDIVDGVLETGEKIVIVDMFKNTLYDLKKIFGEIAVIHTGDQTIEERALSVQNFQDINSSVKIFLGSIQTCNYGLTLTAANKLFILTLPFSVGEYDQVSDRLHRIGQKSVVNIYPLIYKDTIDEYVYDVIESKRKEITKVIDNEDYESNISESVVNDVIEKIKNKHKK